MSDYKSPHGPPPGYGNHYPQQPQQQYQPQSLGPPQSQSSRAPSPGAAQQDPAAGGGGFLEGLKAHFHTRDPLDPPPPSFGRPVPPPSQSHTYAPFQPLVLQSKGEFVADGFNILPPVPPPGAPPVQGTHPFAMHDVNEEDWTRFLEDLKIHGGITHRDNLKANLIPMALHVTTPVGFLVTRAIQKGAKRRRSRMVAELIDVWNAQFFGPRRMRVFLAKGIRVYNPATHEAMPPPDIQYLPREVQKLHLHRMDSWSSSSSSSSNGSSDHGRGRHGQPSPPQPYGAPPSPYGAPGQYGAQPGYYGAPPPQPGYGSAPPQPGYYGYGAPPPAPEPSKQLSKREAKRAASKERKESKRAASRERKEAKKDKRRRKKVDKDAKFRLIVVPA